MSWIKVHTRKMNAEVHGFLTYKDFIYCVLAKVKRINK